MVIRQRNIAKTADEAARAVAFLRERLGDCAWIEPVKAGRQGEYLIYATLELPEHDEEFSAPVEMEAKGT